MAADEPGGRADGIPDTGHGRITGSVPVGETGSAMSFYQLARTVAYSIASALSATLPVLSIPPGHHLPTNAGYSTAALMDRDFSRVDPLACLLDLSASVSKNPAELTPVRPVLEFDMVDPRFVEEADVLSGLDQRPNLMELKPGEFESLITNLFTEMGLETRQTQPSRDGGVDCVAFDNRPIFGGKVIIQAKRYKNTVPVSAIRDLFGSVHNEGASKGILVTTSGFGRASFEFAKDKPLELLSGSNPLPA